jgi:glycosyl-4,4'-diaponeurosporenoate acyltransferase
MEVHLFFSLGTSTALVLTALAWLMWGLFVGWWYRRKSFAQLLRCRRTRRLRGFEKGGSWYEKRLGIKNWKDVLPETGGWKGSLSKRHLRGVSREELLEFAAECHRGELTHWAILAFSPVTFIWTRGWLFGLSCAVGLAASLPFIAVLRYNRCRIGRILKMET